jgi:hypothetical protein
VAKRKRKKNKKNRFFLAIAKKNILDLFFARGAKLSFALLLHKTAFFWHVARNAVSCF